MLLYRYFSSHAFESLRDSRLKASCISSFNDPFESRFGCGGVMTRDKAKKIDLLAKDSLIAQLRTIHPNLSRRDIKDRLRSARPQRLKTFISGYNSTEESAMQERERIIDQTFRVICFASSEAELCDEILMWSHYSASHRGVRVGFDFPTTPSFSISKIEYSHKRVAVDMSLLPFNPDSQTKAIAQSIRTKSSGWAYEKEYRLFCDPSACIKDKDSTGKIIEFISIKSDWVKRVDFGTRYPLNKRASFVELIKKQYPDAECFQARYHKTDYALAYEKLT